MHRSRALGAARLLPAPTSQLGTEAHGDPTPGHGAKNEQKRDGIPAAGGWVCLGTPRDTEWEHGGVA